MIASRVPVNPKSKWEAQKNKLKAKFSKLTFEDLNFDETRKEEMLSKLELKLGITVKELQTMMSTL